MSSLQILKPFARRTEYKMLREWFDVEEKDIGELRSGICVIPAIILLKMSESDRSRLIQWTKEWGNQLMVFPPYLNLDISSLLQLNHSISIKEMNECMYEGVPVREEIVTNLTPKIQLPTKQTVAVDFYYDTSSGCITITTLPLLDYRLLEQRKICQRLFQSLMHSNERDTKDEIREEQQIIFKPVHQYLLLLSAADVIERKQLVPLIQKFFYLEVRENDVKSAFAELENLHYIHSDGTITEKGQQYIMENGYWAFVREIIKRRNDNGEW
ncbi:hypothetical protein [Anoxybacteroides amylolyticum]|uniref:Uncharacterized protein n=1 Tax=Anoxybacteroides amylolyticum TaxID=294699 RepID=A0A167THX2_9BACL|nr:hypothetical protein [Anoxybacillus amylolyticus]ANB60840.1 hypothetical protein GFC30_2035 [Anoxybacillus amylolyticus]